MSLDTEKLHLNCCYKFKWRCEAGNFNCLKLRKEILTGDENLEVIGISVTLKQWERMQYL